MSTTLFKPASRRQLKLRMALDGPAGAGKTYSALRFAFGLAGESGRVAVIDTEHGSASKYQGECPDGITWQFDVCELEHYAPSTYTQVIREAGRVGYDVLIIDSLSHAWEGAGGALDQVDRKASHGGNSFTAWRDVTPQHREMVEAILACPCHVIATMRSKMEYVLEEQTNKNGKKVLVPKKLGLAPVQRQGTEYEFDVVCDLDLEHTLTVSKTRCPAIDGAKASKPGAAFLGPLQRWLGQGEPRAAAVDPSTTTSPLAAAAGDDDKRTTMRTTDPATEDQVDRIKALAKGLGMPAAAIHRTLAKRGAKRIADLTFAQATELIAKLEGKRRDRDLPF